MSLCFLRCEFNLLICNVVIHFQISFSHIFCFLNLLCFPYLVKFYLIYFFSYKNTSPSIIHRGSLCGNPSEVLCTWKHFCVQIIVLMDVKFKLPIFFVCMCSFCCWDTKYQSGPCFIVSDLSLCKLLNIVSTFIYIIFLFVFNVHELL